MEEKERFLDGVKYMKPPAHITEINVCRELERKAACFCNTTSRKLNHILLKEMLYSKQKEPCIF